MESSDAERETGGSPNTRRCRWCSRPFEVTPGPGRPREYCRRSCRQRDYEARRQSAALGLGDGHIVVARADVEAFNDRLYALESAIEDVERDLEATGDPGGPDYAEALGWVLEAARPLVALRLGPGAG